MDSVTVARPPSSPSCNTSHWSLDTSDCRVAEHHVPATLQPPPRLLRRLQPRGLLPRLPHLLPRPPAARRHGRGGGGQLPGQLSGHPRLPPPSLRLLPLPLPRPPHAL